MTEQIVPSLRSLPSPARPLRAVAGPGAPGREAPDAPDVGPREPLWRDVLGWSLRRLRHERGETLTETAARAGVSPQYLSEMERGVKDPSSEMIAAVAGALGTSLVDLAEAVAAELRGALELRGARELTRLSAVRRDGLVSDAGLGAFLLAA